MKLYVWQNHDLVSDSYHSGGSAAAIAKTEESAKNLLNTSFQGCVIRDIDHPTYVRRIYGQEEKAFVFPDAGCC